LLLGIAPNRSVYFIICKISKISRLNPNNLKREAQHLLILMLGSAIKITTLPRISGQIVDWFSHCSCSAFRPSFILIFFAFSRKMNLPDEFLNKMLSIVTYFLQPPMLSPTGS